MRRSRSTHPRTVAHLWHHHRALDLQPIQYPQPAARGLQDRAGRDRGHPVRRPRTGAQIRSAAGCARRGGARAGDRARRQAAADRRLQHDRATADLLVQRGDLAAGKFPRVRPDRQPVARRLPGARRPHGQLPGRSHRREGTPAGQDCNFGVRLWRQRRDLAQTGAERPPQRRGDQAGGQPVSGDLPGAHRVHVCTRTAGAGLRGIPPAGHRQASQLHDGGRHAAAAPGERPRSVLSECPHRDRRSTARMSWSTTTPAAIWRSCGTAP